MDNLGIKPNYAALGRKYGMDWRTVRKYHEGYEGRPTTRHKKSRLDEYKRDISDKLEINRITVRGVYEIMVKKYGYSRIGSYTNFNRYVNINGLKPKSCNEGHPRYEKEPGQQAQADWKEYIKIADRNGEIFVINVLHIVLKYSRFSHLDMSVQKRFDDVSRGLINGFKKFGGVPGELLFDNMSTVANTNAKPKKPTDSVSRLTKDFGFKVRFCGTRKPETKGCVEAKNKVIDWIRAYEGEFEGMEELASTVETINRDMNININQETGISPTALFYKEKEYLQPLPAKDIIDAYLMPTEYKVSDLDMIADGSNTVLDAMYKLSEMEISFRKQQAVMGCVKVANFPYLKEINKFDFGFQPSIDRTKIMDLITLRFIEKGENVIFCGTPGVERPALRYPSE